MQLLKNIVSACLLAACLPHAEAHAQDYAKITGNTYVQSKKTLVYTDAAYERNIRSVQLHPANDVTAPAVLSLNQSIPLILSFDDLYETADDYRADLTHCNADWQPSDLRAVEYLYDYNEFNLNTYSGSVNTKARYFHYTFEIPKVKVSGNYLLKVWRGSDKTDLILTRRFVVYQDLTQVALAVSTPLNASDAQRKQQINLNVSYAATDLQNPQQQVTAVIRQNQRWQSNLALHPLYVHDYRKTLDFNYFNGENLFWALNEFRFFSFANWQAGFNVQQAVNAEPLNQITLYPVTPRNNKNYNDADRQDLNGRFVIGNSTNRRPETEADYAQVYVTLRTETPYAQNVYVVGDFNAWQPHPDAQMRYQNGVYTANLLLKQGTYDYAFALWSGQPDQQPDLLSIDGTQRLTHNEYDAFIYYRPFGARADAVIGYARLIY